MMQLAVLTKSHCLLKQSGSYLKAAHINITRSICFRQSPGRNAATRLFLSPQSTQYVPKRCLQKEVGFKGRHTRDKVPESYKLIYQSNIHNRVLLIAYGVGSMAALFLTSVSIFVATVMDYEMTHPVTIYDTYAIPLKIAIPLMYFSIVLMVPMSYHVGIAAKRVIRIYYNADSKQFIGIMKVNFRKRKVEFTLKDVLPIIETKSSDTNNIVIKDIGHTLFPSDFVNSEYMNLFMRYT